MLAQMSVAILALGRSLHSRSGSIHAAADDIVRGQRQQLRGEGYLPTLPKKESESVKALGLFYVPIVPQKRTI